AYREAHQSAKRVAQHQHPAVVRESVKDFKAPEMTELPRQQIDGAGAWVATAFDNEIKTMRSRQ
ncbi:MAG: hypothetical protein ACI8XD_000213, partial [Thermoproteota archaeon]